MPDFSRIEYRDSYVPLCRELDISPPGGYALGDQFWADGVHVVHPGMPRIPEGAVWLPGIFDWLELLEVAGHSAIVFEDTITPAGGVGWLVYPLGNRDDFGSGITREAALARIWAKTQGNAG